MSDARVDADAWRLACRQLGLRPSATAEGGRVTLGGLVGGARVEITSRPLGHPHEPAIAVEVRASGGEPLIELAAMASYNALTPEQGLKTGDERFDGAIFVWASRDALPLFDQEMRRAFIRLLGVRGGWVKGAVVGLPEGAAARLRSAEEIVLVVGELAALARRLTSRQKTLIERLVDNAFCDPWPGVRAENHALMLEKARSPSTAREVKLATIGIAATLGDAALGVLAPLVETHSESVSVRRAALAQLLANFPFEALKPIIVRSQREGGGVGLLDIILDYLGRKRPRGAGDLLVQLTHDVPVSALPQLVAPLAAADMGAPRHQRRLLELLEVDSRPLRLKLLTALAQLANLQAVEPIQRLTGGGFFRDRELKAAALAAIDAIQERHARGARGGLSVSAQGGELSPPAAPSGALSDKTTRKDIPASE